MKPQWAPSILSCDFSDFRGAVAGLIEAGSDWIHFDVMDGQFVPPITFGDATVRDLRPLGPTPFEAHLMTLTPERHFEAFAAAGCSRIIFHVEATHHSHRLAQQLRKAGIQAGVAINPGTSWRSIEEVIGEVDLALVMTVNPGWGGQSLIERCLDKVRALRELAPELEIEVDGGIDPSTVKRAFEAGANVFVVGSFLMRAENPRAGLDQLRFACG